MTAAAANKFAQEAKKTIAQWEKDLNVFYTKFVAGKEVPTVEDVKELTQMVTWAKQTSKIYHSVPIAAVQGFGGAQDNKIYQAETLLKTVATKAKKGAK